MNIYELWYKKIFLFKKLSEVNQMKTEEHVTHPSLHQAITNAANIQCLNPDRLQMLIEMGAFEILFNPRAQISKTSLMQALNLDQDELIFIANYGLSSDELCSATNLKSAFSFGKLENWEVEIPEHTLSGAKRLRGEILDFPKGTSLSETKQRLELANMRHATVYELLFFVSKIKEMKIETNKKVIALGTPLTGVYTWGGRKPCEQVYLSMSKFRSDNGKIRFHVTAEHWVIDFIESHSFLVVQEI